MIQKFSELSLVAPLQESLAQMKFTSPTPIQAESLPITLAGKNLVGCSKTGSGKTVAYCLPLIQRLMENPEQSGLILAPTRELVMQIGQVLENLLRNSKGLKKVELIGGQSIQYQIRMLKKKPFPRILVATPGRLIDLMERNAVYVKRVEMLVLDEADRMLDMGFAPQLEKIEKRLPKKDQRQTLMFSATMPKEVDSLVQKFLDNEVRITQGSPEGDTKHIKQSVVLTDFKNKREGLLDKLVNRAGSVIVFSGSKHRTDRLAGFLHGYGHKVSLIHGDRSQGQRNRAIKDFRSGKSTVLVATDIAARGIDVPQVETVINFDLPRASEDYTHRIGRSGRAGRAGEAITFVLKQEKHQWKKIVKQCGLDSSLLKFEKLQGSTSEKDQAEKRSDSRSRKRRPGGRKELDNPEKSKQHRQARRRPKSDRFTEGEDGAELGKRNPRVSSEEQDFRRRRHSKPSQKRSAKSRPSERFKAGNFSRPKSKKRRLSLSL